MDVFDLTAKITLDTSGYLRSLDQVRGQTNGLGATLKSGLSTAAKVGTAAFAAITAAAGKFGYDSVQTGMEFDKAMAQVAATLGVSVDEIQNLDEFAQEMGRTTAFTATQSAEALNYMALAGYTAEESIGMLPNVLNLAAAGQLDLAYASDMVTDAQTALGIEMQDMTGFVDELAKTASTTNTSVGQLGEAILTIGGTAKFMKGGTEELNQVLGLLADNGIKGSEAGTHLRNMLLKLSDPTDEGANAIENLGLQVFDTEGKMRSFQDIFLDLSDAMEGFTEEEKINAFSALFNTRDVAAATALLNTTEKRWNAVASAIEGAWYSAGALDKVFNVMGSDVNFKTIVGGFESLGISVEDATDALNRSGGDTQKFVDNLWEMADAGVTMDDILKAMPADLDEMQVAFDNTASAAQGMAETQLDNLAGDITIFNSALDGAKLAISKGLSPALRDFVQYGTESLSKLTKSFKEGGIESVVDDLASIFADGVTTIASYIPDMILLGGRFISSFVKSIWDNMPEIIESAKTLAESFVTNILEKAPDVINAGLEFLLNLAEGAQEGIPIFLADILPRIMELTGELRTHAGEIVDAGLNIILDLLQGLINGLPELITYVPTIISNIAGIINDNGPKILAAGIELIGMLLTGIIDALPTLIAEFPKIIKAIFDVITAANWLQLGANVITWIKNGVENMSKAIPTKLAEIAKSAINGVKSLDWRGLGISLITFIKNGIISLLHSIPNKLLEIGESALSAVMNINWIQLGVNIVAGIASGITDSVGVIVDAAWNAAASALNAAKSFLGIRSPSKVFREQVGKMMALGMGEGFEDNVPVEAMKSSVEDAIGAIEDVDAPMIGLDQNGNPKRPSGSFFVTFNIYTDPSQDEDAVARSVQDKFLTWYEQEIAIA